MVASRLDCLVPHSLLMFVWNHDKLFRQIICNGAFNEIKHILAHEHVRRDEFYLSTYLLLSIYMSMHLIYVLNLPQFKVFIWNFVVLWNLYCILTKHMLGLIGRAIVGRFNGYLCCCISTRASTSFHNGYEWYWQVIVNPAAPTSAGAREHARINCRRARAHLHLRPRSRVFARSDFATIPRSSLHAASLPPRLSVLATQLRH